MRKAKYIGRKVNPLNFYVTASPSKKSRDQSDHRCTTNIYNCYYANTESSHSEEKREEAGR